MAGGIVNLIFRCFKQGSGAKDVADDISRLSGGMRGLAKASQILGTTLGGVANVAGRMVRTALTGGVWELAAEGVNALIGKWKEYKEKAAKAAEDAAKAFRDSLSKAVDAISKKFSDVVGGIQRIGKVSRDQAAVISSSHDVGTRAAEAGIDQKTRAALANATTDSERNLIEANAKLEKARLSASKEYAKAFEGMERARDDQTMAAKRVVAAEEALADAEELAEKAQDNLTRATTRYKLGKARKGELDAATEANDKAQKALESATDKLAEERANSASAEAAYKVAQNKLREAEIVDGEIRAAAEFELAETKRKLKEAAEKEAAARAEEATRIKAEIEAEEAETEAREALAETYQNLAEQAKEKLRDQARQLQRLNESIFRVKSRYDEALRGIDRTKRGQSADSAHTNGLFGPYQYGGRSNGGESFIDWDRANRFAGWGDRDAGKAARRDAAAQKRYDRIRDALKNGERVSKSDEAFYNKFKAYQDQKGGAEKLKAALEAAQKKRDQLQDEMKKALESIDKNIKAALAVG